MKIISSTPIIRLQQALLMLLDFQIAQVKPVHEPTRPGGRKTYMECLYELQDVDGEYRWVQIGDLAAAREEVARAQYELS